jgi:hypothetical protein
MRNTKRFLLAALLILYGASAQAATQPASIEPAASVAEPALAGRLAQSKPGLRAWLASIFRLGKDDTFLTDEQEFSQSDKRYSLGGGKAIDCDYWFNQILPNFFKINPNKITEKNIFLATGVGGLYKSIKDNALSTKEKPGDLNEVVGIFREYAESKFAYNFVTLPEDLPGDDDQKIATKTTLLKAIQESFFKLELFNILLETKLDLLRLYWIRYNIVDTLLANIDKINSQKFINETFSNSVRDVFYAPNVKFIYDVWVNVKIDMILNWVNAWNKIEESKFERVGEKPAWAKWVGKDTRHYKEVLQHAYLSPKLALIAKFAFIKEENTIETSNAWIFEREPLLSNLTNKDTTSNFLNFLNNLPGKADWYSKHRYTIALYLEQLFVYEKFKDFSDDKETLSKLITTQQIKIFKPSLSSIFALLGEADDLPNPADNPIQTKLRDRIAEMLGVVTPPE